MLLPALFHVHVCADRCLKPSRLAYYDGMHLCMSVCMYAVNIEWECASDHNDDGVV